MSCHSLEFAAVLLSVICPQYAASRKASVARGQRSTYLGALQQLAQNLREVCGIGYRLGPQKLRVGFLDVPGQSPASRGGGLPGSVEVDRGELQPFGVDNPLLDEARRLLRAPARAFGVDQPTAARQKRPQLLARPAEALPRIVA